MLFGDAFHQCETEPRAAVASSPRGGKSRKALEDSVSIAFRDAGSIVIHDQYDRVWGAAYLDVDARGPIPRCVVEHIAHEVPEAGFVAARLGRFDALRIDRDRA